MPPNSESKYGSSEGEETLVIDAQHLKDAIIGKDGGVKVDSHNQIRPLHCAAQQYAWGRLGSSSTVARMKDAQVQRDNDTTTGNNDDDSDDFDDFEIDESKPYAELWLGTHPNGMCEVTVEDENGRSMKRTLLEYVRSDPMLHCGDFDTTDITFLLKVLSVRKVLSIQAHPDKDLAERLHAERPKVYKDPNHKPEMAIALSERVRAMCGFRPLMEISHHLDTYVEFRQLLGENTAVEIAALHKATPQQVRECLQTMFHRYMDTDATVIASLVEGMVARLRGGNMKNLTDLEKLIMQLNDQFPGDCGIFAPLMFNVVELKKGQGLFIEANEPHAYISGEIIECMACSDNVVRAGLTPKLKDVPTLVNMLTYKTCMPYIDSGTRVDACTVRYQPPVPDFCVDYINVPAGQVYEISPVNSPSVLLTIEGEACVRQPTCSYDMGYGSAGFLSANTSCTVLAGPYGIQLTRAYTNVYYNHNQHR